MVQFKQDQKIICLLPVTTVHISSEARSHDGPVEGEGLRLSVVYCVHHIHCCKTYLYIWTDTLLKIPN